MNIKNSQNKYLHQCFSFNFGKANISNIARRRTNSKGKNFYTLPKITIRKQNLNIFRLYTVKACSIK